MGQTLPNDIYLPAEGERNCYDGLEGNWRSLDSLISTVAGKASATHTHGNITNDGKVGTTANLPLITGTGGVVQAGSFGNQANTFCEGNDSRLSDARTPVAHTHTKSDVTDLFNSNFIPSANNSYDLGSASYQWKSVYAQTYYYNGTEFQNKFVTLDTSQTISGLKYFSSNILHKTPQTIDVSTNPAETITGEGLQFVDNTQYWGDITPQWTIDGTFRIRIAMTNYNTSGTSTGWFCPLVLDLAKDGSKVDVWSTHLNSNLGTPTNKWKSVYSDSYYYGTTAWGLDKANEWTGSNTFSNATNSVFCFKFGTSGSYSDIRWIDNNGSHYATLRGRVNELSLGLQYSSASAWYSGASITISNNGIVQIKAYDGTEPWTVNFAPVGVYPTSNNALELGTSTHKWKTLNGVNPGVLSLPDFDNADPIDFSQWDTTGAVGLNYYTPAVNGWLNISIWDRATNSIFVYRSGKERVGVFGNGSMASDGRIALLMPVQANATYVIIIKANANSDIYAANFFPCLGNV